MARVRKALAQQQPLMVESFAPIVNTVIKGEAPLGITYLNCRTIQRAHRLRALEPISRRYQLHGSEQEGGASERRQIVRRIYLLT